MRSYRQQEAEELIEQLAHEVAEILGRRADRIAYDGGNMVTRLTHVASAAADLGIREILGGGKHDGDDHSPTDEAAA